MDALVVKNARQHNLKNVSLVIPRDKLIVFTGPSGSGKTSLAFDTIYAEGQRRYVESLSAYARQFLAQLGKPDVESIEGLSPAIAIEQKSLGKSPRSTVGTVTEIADYLRLLFARVGIPHCPQCGSKIEAQTKTEIVDTILGYDEGSKLLILAPLVQRRKGELRLELDRLRRDGYVRARIDGQIVDLGDDIVLDKQKLHDLDVVVDRLVLKDGVGARLGDSVELALKLGSGTMMVLVDGEPDARVLSERFACLSCGVSLPAIEPRLFSFNGPHGACPSCAGLGRSYVIDEAKCVLDPARTLRGGAIAAWGKPGSVAHATELQRCVAALGVSPDVPFQKLDEATCDAILHGTAGAKKGRSRAAGSYEGVVPKLTRLFEEGEVRTTDEESEDGDDAGEPQDLGAWDVSRFVVQRTCAACSGKRLRPEALAVRLGERTIVELSAMSLERLQAFVASLRKEADFSRKDRTIAEPLLRAVSDRLGFLTGVGLDYLSLDRPSGTLSGGEGQRIRLATQIGAALVGVLYVLDEPSVGLHARDTARLLAALRRLADIGNTVLVVEHDREAILAADHVVDMGPGAGVRGGEIVAEGPPASLAKNPKSVTGPYLAGKRGLVLPKRKKPTKKALKITGARSNNLKDVTCEIPIGLFTAVTGVSGSGKSSLIADTLLPAVRAELYGAERPIGACDRIDGIRELDKVISIDQSPIGKTPRSNPATYTGLFAHLRELFASIPEAKARGYKAGRFSFNVKGGRCEACAGDGVLRVEMHFLPDVYVTCDACQGKRYSRETLDIQWRGHSIADILDMTVQDARALFEAHTKMRDLLVSLERVGLGYLPLGQPATTLSGGESQRVKLARELAKKSTGRTLYVLDEPTTGLHFSDIELLLLSLQALSGQGNTVLVIEHNLDVIACADWVIDIGPEGGEKGGRVVATGTPEDVAKCAASFTGRHLKEVLRSAKKA